MIREFASDIAYTFFPPVCLGCLGVLACNPHAVFCRECRNQITFLTGGHCPVCGMIFPDSPSGDHLCGSCIEQRPWFTQARSAVAFDGIILEAIHSFKYGRSTITGDRLAGFLADYDFTDMDWRHFDCILPVPLHIRRLRERRFNQSLILARALGRKHKLPVDFSLLKRRRFTSTQTGLDKNEREKNMKSAFEIVHPERLAGQHVILVDDVFTTGATTNECARALKKAGAGEIAVVTLARVL